jgi:putative glutamine amidotransferase
VGVPVIGITAAIEAAAWGVWREVDANVLPRTYSVRVDESGGLPLVLPASETATESPGELVDLIDGLILGGGADVDPATYGAETDPRTTAQRIERDRFEIALARAALERDVPLLGICRGMELMNVACGGTLDQHLPDAEVHLHTPGRYADHEVVVEPGSLVARTIGAERVAVRSHHHQGVARLGDGVVATGWAEPGRAIEAIELPERRWAVGVLWHAEEDGSSPLIAALAAAARAGVRA